MDAKEALEIIQIKDAEIKAKEEDVNQLKSQRSGYWTILQKAIEAGDTTGDPIRDLVVRTNSDFDAELEARYRKLETRLQGKTGELVLFTYSVEKCTKHVFIPTRHSQNEYDDFWYAACGVLSNDKLRLRRRISLPVEELIVAGFNWFHEMKFEIEKGDPFDNFDLSSPKLDGYAEVTTSSNSQLMFLAGDDAVKLWFAERRQPGQFRKCCDLLSKLVLEPTEE